MPSAKDARTSVGGKQVRAWGDVKMRDQDAKQYNSTTGGPFTTKNMDDPSHKSSSKRVPGRTDVLEGKNWLSAGRNEK